MDADQLALVFEARAVIEMLTFAATAFVTCGILLEICSIFPSNRRTTLTSLGVAAHGPASEKTTSFRRYDRRRGIPPLPLRARGRRQPRARGRSAKWTSPRS